MSLTQSLSQRFKEHKKSLSRCKSKEIIELGDDCEIVLIENYSCDNKEQLRIREQYWINELIEDNEVVNERNAFGINKQHYQEYRKEYMKDYNKNNTEYLQEYYEKNRDKIIEQVKQYQKENHIKNRQRNLDYRKQHYQKNKEKSNERSRLWRLDNKQKSKEYFKERRFFNKYLDVMSEFVELLNSY